MCIIQPKISMCIKKQKNITHNQEKNQLIKNKPTVVQMLELVDKNVETAITNILHMFNSIMRK